MSSSRSGLRRCSSSSATSYKAGFASRSKRRSASVPRSYTNTIRSSAELFDTLCERVAAPLEAEPVIEWLDIHAKPCDVLPLANQPKIATHIFKAILLMAQRGPHGTRNLREQIGGRHLCREGEPDRHHVGGDGHRVPQ